MRLENFLKVSTDLAILVSRGKWFQRLGAEATKARSPRVVKVLKWWDSSIPSLDRSRYLEFLNRNGPAQEDWNAFPWCFVPNYLITELSSCDPLLSYFEKIAHISVVWAYVSLWLCMIGCLLQGPIRLKVLWIDE